MDITLLIPCYNEEINLQKGVLDKIGNFTKSDARFIEVILIDDGSTDESKEIIKDKYLTQFPKFKLVENKHQGKAFAIISGIRESRGEYIIFTDIDLATPIEESDKLIQSIEKGSQIAIGSRSVDRQGAPITRKIMSLGNIVIRSVVLGLDGIHDTQCGFKMFNTKIALKIIDRLLVFHNQRMAVGSSVTAGFDLEFLFIARKLDYRIEEVPVHWKHVETKNVNFLKDSLDTLKDIALIKINDIKGAYHS